jgi:hypothetical protein
LEEAGVAQCPVRDAQKVNVFDDIPDAEEKGILAGDWLPPKGQLIDADHRSAHCPDCIADAASMGEPQQDRDADEQTDEGRATKPFTPKKRGRQHECGFR